MNNIYLDYAASSLKHFDIIKNSINELEKIYSNPSSNHSLGKKNKKLLEDSRKKIAKYINSNPEEITFTSGGTEANNTVFNHIKNSYKNGEILISNIEHSSVKESAYNIEKFGFKIIEILTDSSGKILIDDLKKKISYKTILISVMYANNETGIIQPIKEISQIIKNKNILFHSDIVQAYGKVKIDVKELNIDFASASSHKIGGTNNFGFLYSKKNCITPFILGGGQENGLRSGTSDVLGAIVLERCTERTLENISKLENLKNYFITSLKDNKVNFEINGDLKNSLPNILNLYFHNITSQRLITYLDVNNIYISGGSACSSGNIKASKVITSMYSEKRAEKSVRISIGFNTTKEMIDITVKKIMQLENKILDREVKNG